MSCLHCDCTFLVCLFTDIKAGILFGIFGGAGLKMMQADDLLVSVYAYPLFYFNWFTQLLIYSIIFRFTPFMFAAVLLSCLLMLLGFPRAFYEVCGEVRRRRGPSVVKKKIKNCHCNCAIANLFLIKCVFLKKVNQQECSLNYSQTIFQNNVQTISMFVQPLSAFPGPAEDTIQQL